ncbi:MAG: hypothetical protein HKN33_06450 [Pyrinomonadaceae bacterium]|nr:hypothetical protein [Pyrinomonadaceae bacterium]
MGLQVNNSPYSRFYETQNSCCVQNQQANNSQINNRTLANLFASLSKLFGAAAGGNPYDAVMRQLLGGSTGQPRVEDYGGFKFKSQGEKARIDQAIAELRAEQAANPGKKVSKKFKIGKYKYRVTLDENGQLHLKRKKKKKGFFSKIGSAFKKIGKGIGKLAKKALPILSTVGMFIPGLQPFALAARVATGAMGVINGIKNGNIFGAVMSGVSAFSGLGSKLGGFMGNLGSRATGFLGNLGSRFMNNLGSAGQWLTNTFNTGRSWLNAGRQWLSNWTNGMGSRVTDFLNLRGSRLLNNMTRTFGGRFGQFLQQRGPALLEKFSSRMGARAANWLYEGISNRFQRVIQKPFGPTFQNLFNSGFAQFLIGLLQRRQV